MQGLILFCRGSNQARWADPLEALRQSWQDENPAISVQLAFIEYGRPNLYAAIRKMVEVSITKIVVCPVFFGEHGYLRNELQPLLNLARKAFPGVEITATPHAGSDPGVMAAVKELAKNHFKKEDL